MGSGYVIEHCVAAIKRIHAQEIYENYIADCLYYIAHQTGIKLSKRLNEIRHPEPVDERTPEEIIEERTQRLGITVVKKDGCNEPDRTAGTG